MDIDVIKLEGKIEDLISKVLSAKSVTEYRYIVSTLRTLNDLYKELCGNYYKVDTRGNQFYNKYIENDSKKIINTRINTCFLDNEYNSFLAFKLLKIYYNSEFLDYMISINEEHLKINYFLDIIYSFANSYDNKFYNILKEMINDKKIAVRKSGRDSTFNLIYDRDSYILMSMPYTIDSAGALIHEIGHVYCNRMLSDRSKSQMYNDEKSFYEFYSEYVELLFYDYIRKNNIKYRDSLFSENAFLASLEYFLVDLYDSYEFKNLNLNNDTLDVISEAYVYSYGMVLAIEMVDRYYEDKKDITTRCNNFLYMQGLQNSYEELNTLGISKDELIKGNALKKRIERHNNDIKNLFLK